MHFLIYTSAATDLMDEPSLARLLEDCRRRNLADDVTGMLLYKDGSFMQVLEGDRDTIFHTFDRIGRDDRHKDIMLLRDREITARNFNGWSMGFRALRSDDLDRMPGYARLGGELFSSPAFTDQPHIALQMLKTFHQTTR
ncbi:BLUF domain-containing protein [Rhodobacteraceae bacterium NNCM2]|nr:BLUF domain-containing protein [Coraliihabitans acroporae]